MGFSDWVVHILWGYLTNCSICCLNGRSGPICIFVIFTTITRARNRVRARNVRVCRLFISKRSVLRVGGDCSWVIGVVMFILIGIRMVVVVRSISVIFKMFICWFG